MKAREINVKNHVHVVCLGLFDIVISRTPRPSPSDRLAIRWEIIYRAPESIFNRLPDPDVLWVNTLRIGILFVFIEYLPHQN